MSMIEEAIRFAGDAHAGQMDKGQVPLILHPLHVMSQMTSDTARVVAVLHDVLEDTDKTVKDLRKDFPPDVVEAVVLLTRDRKQYDESEKGYAEQEKDYADYVERILGTAETLTPANELAIEVKLADLQHNMDLGRVPNSESDIRTARRQARYRKAHARLILGRRERRKQADLDALASRPQRNEYAREAVEYRHARPDYEQYADVLQLILESACRTYAPLAIVTARAKKVDGFIEKCYRKKCRETQRDPLGEQGFTDLCGARVIVHTTQQVEEVCEFIREQFTIVEEGDTKTRLKDSEFGYLSYHFIVKFKPDTPFILGVDTHLEFLKNLKAEIQVRTVLQHAWADMLHDRLYKAPVKPLKRHDRFAAQLAALMETGDTQYERLVEDFDVYSLNTTIAKPMADVERELAILRGMNEKEIYSFTRLANSLKMAGFQRIVGRHDETVALLKDFVEQLDPNLDKTTRARLLYEYGYAQCKGKGQTHINVHADGRKNLKKAIEEYGQPSPARNELWTHDKRFYLEMLLAMGECATDEHVRQQYHEKALGVDATNPYALCKLVHVYQNSSAHMAATLKAAIRVADDHRTTQINVPSVYFALGRLNFAAGKEDRGFAHYCEGLRFFVNLPETERKNLWLEDKLRAERDYLKNNTLKPATDALNRMTHSLYARLYNEPNPPEPAAATPRLFIAAPAGDTGPLHEALSTARLTGTVLNISDKWAAVNTLMTAALVDDETHDVYLYIDANDSNADTVVHATLAMGIHVICVNQDLADKLIRDSIPQRFYGVPNERESLLWVMLTPKAPEAPLDDTFVINAAKKSHEAYIKNKDTNQWDNLETTYKNSNISQVKSSVELLRQHGFDVVPAGQSASPRVEYAQLSDDEQDALAKAEHGRWVAERVKEGWIYGPRRDNDRNRNPNIAPWDSLSDKVKRYDYVTIETWFETFAANGYHVVRGGGNAPR